MGTQLNPVKKPEPAPQTGKGVSASSRRMAERQQRQAMNDLIHWTGSTYDGSPEGLESDEYKALREAAGTGNKAVNANIRNRQAQWEADAPKREMEAQRAEHAQRMEQMQQESAAAQAKAQAAANQSKAQSAIMESNQSSIDAAPIIEDAGGLVIEESKRKKQGKSTLSASLGI